MSNWVLNIKALSLEYDWIDALNLWSKNKTYIIGLSIKLKLFWRGKNVMHTYSIVANDSYVVHIWVC